MGIETAIGAALITTAGSLVGSSMTNASNEALADKANNTQINLANTAHQREVADLKAAGLNPILSAGGSGAASPSMQVPPVINSLGNAMNEGITNFSALQSSRQYNPLIDKVRSETALNNALTAKAAADATTAVSTSRNINAKTSQERYGYLGKLLGTSAADATRTIENKLHDIISNITVNSAKKVNPPSSSVPAGSNKNLFDNLKGMANELF